MSEKSLHAAGLAMVAKHHDRVSHVRFWLFAAACWMFLFGCAPIVVMFYLEGMKSRNASPDAMLQALERGENVPIAIESLRSFVMKAMREIKKHEGDEGRQGMLARNAGDHFQKEANK